MGNSEKNKESQEPKGTQKPAERPRPVVHDSYIDLGYGATNADKIDSIIPKLKK